MNGQPSACQASEVPDEVRDLIHEQELCVLATVFVDIPHTSLMGYIASPDCRRLYMASEPGTKKVANIRRNPNVAVLVDSRRAALDGGQGLSLTIKGNCRELSDGPERDHALAVLAGREYLRELFDDGDVAVLEVEAQSFHLLRGTMESMFIVLDEVCEKEAKKA